MMIFSNLKMAIASLQSAKWRSLLTMLGIIIGVFSVVTIVSIGEGVKQQLVGQINHLGDDLVTIRPGKAVTRSKEGDITGVNFLTAFSGSTLTETDLRTVVESKDVGVAVPLSIIAGIPRTEEREFQNGVIIATTEGMPIILNQKIEFGTFFTDTDAPKDAVIIGKRVAEELFVDNVPLGSSMSIRGQRFIVRGVFEEFPNSPLSYNADFNRAIFIPYNTGKELSGGQPQISQVLAKPSDPKRSQEVAGTIRENLLRTHAGQEDFTVLNQDENLEVASTVINLVTNMITAVAAISLFVGGIGIMNIMLVSVTERTHEIGVRKAIGATNRQILNQFLTEALLLSFIGGVLGVLASLIANYFIRIFTSLTPVITLPIILITVGVSVAVGIIFGVTPAMKAARKDPIQALRGL